MPVVANEDSVTTIRDEEAAISSLRIPRELPIHAEEVSGWERAESLLLPTWARRERYTWSIGVLEIKAPSYGNYVAEV